MKTFNELKALEKTWAGYIERSKRAYERNDTEKEVYWAKKLELEIKDYGITCDWPGLYPCFRYKGMEFYTVESLINELSKERS